MDCEVIGWCALKPEVQAAWVQAVGSVIGIAVAVVIPLATARREKKQRDRDATAKARTYALYLMPQAARLRSKLWNAQILFSDSEHDDLAQVIEVLHEATKLDTWGLQLHELGQAGELLQRSIAAATEALKRVTDLEFHNSFNGQIINRETGETAQFDPPGPITPEIQRASDLAEQAIAALEALFD